MRVCKWCQGGLGKPFRHPVDLSDDGRTVTYERFARCEDCGELNEAPKRQRAGRATCAAPECGKFADVRGGGDRMPLCFGHFIEPADVRAGWAAS